MVAVLPVILYEYYLSKSRMLLLLWMEVINIFFGLTDLHEKKVGLVFGYRLNYFSTH